MRSARDVFSSRPDAVDTSVCDLIFLREQDALCDLVKARVHLVFPYWDLVILTLVLALAPKRKAAPPWSQSKSKSLRASMSCLWPLAQPVSSARFCGCFPKRSNCADTLLIRSFCQRCWIKS